MSTEIELKLAINKDSVKKFLSLDIFSGYSAQTFWLKNTYFDTPDKQLTELGYVLRTREKTGQFVQTLKSRGQNLGGLHQRDEWEMPIDTEQLNFSLFPPGALPMDIPLTEISPLFETNFERTAWLISYKQSKIEIVLDVGHVEAKGGTDEILEIELELKDGYINELFSLAIELSREVALMPSDISKAERGYRLGDGHWDVAVELPKILPSQTMESAFCDLFSYELTKVQRLWQIFWSTGQWSHLNSVLVTLGNMTAELECFTAMLPKSEQIFVNEHIEWMVDNLRPILSWWPACFELSHDAVKQPESIAISLQQCKAKKALAALQGLRQGNEFGHRVVVLMAWLFNRNWTDSQNVSQVEVAAQSVVERIDECFDQALTELKTDCFTGSISSALSQTSAVHRLFMICRYFDRLYGKDFGQLYAPIQALEDSLCKLSAMDVVIRLKDWLNDLPQEEQASVYSWTRSHTVVLRDIKVLASKLIRGRGTFLRGVV